VEHTDVAKIARQIEAQQSLVLSYDEEEALVWPGLQMALLFRVKANRQTDLGQIILESAARERERAERRN